MITTRAAYASGPPPAFEPLRETSDFVLWKRTGPVGERRTLAEGDRPGAPLDCSSAAGRRLSRRRRHGNGLRRAARDRRRLVAEPHGRERLGLLAGADAAAGSLADLDPVRRHPAAAHHAPRGWTRPLPAEPRLPRLGPLLRRGRAHRPPPRPGPVHGQRRATAARGPPAGRLLGGPSRGDRRHARRRRSPAGRSPARASAESRCAAPAAATWTGIRPPGGR